MSAPSSTSHPAAAATPAPYASRSGSLPNVLKPRVRIRKKPPLLPGDANGNASEMARLFDLGAPSATPIQGRLCRLRWQALTVNMNVYSGTQPAAPTSAAARPRCSEIANVHVSAPIGDVDEQSVYERGWEEAWLPLHKGHLSVPDVADAFPTSPCSRTVVVRRACRPALPCIESLATSSEGDAAAGCPIAIPFYIGSLVVVEAIKELRLCELKTDRNQTILTAITMLAGAPEAQPFTRQLLPTI